MPQTPIISISSQQQEHKLCNTLFTMWIDVVLINAELQLCRGNIWNSYKQLVLTCSSATTSLLEIVII